MRTFQRYQLFHTQDQENVLQCSDKNMTKQSYITVLAGHVELSVTWSASTGGVGTLRTLLTLKESQHVRQMFDKNVNSNILFSMITSRGQECALK